MLHLPSWQCAILGRTPAVIAIGGGIPVPGASTAWYPQPESTVQHQSNSEITKWNT